MKGLILLAVLILATTRIPVLVSAAEGQTVNILVAYDEEMAATPLAFWAYGGLTPLREVVTAERYCEIQVLRGVWRFSRFNMTIKIVGFTTWESDNSLFWLEDLMEDMVDKIGFTSGMLWNGEKAHILVGFTNQEDIENSGGICHIGDDTILIQHFEDWTGDNQVMHEVSHVFGAEHCYEGDCVMSGADQFVICYSEPLEPVHAGSVLLWLWQSQKIAYFSYTWCPTAESEILANRDKFNEDPPSPGPSGPGGGSSRFEICAMKSWPYNPPTLQTYILRCVPLILFVITATVLAYLCSRRVRRT